MKLVLVLCLSIYLQVVIGAKAPNIVFIIADDLGFNDVSLHGSRQINTTNIDALAKDGVVLDNYYATSVCSPTRSTILTGRHISHTGVYAPLPNNQFLNLSFTLLPQYLKNCCGYSTHIVGKWHLGFNTNSTLPNSRGFDTYLGYWSGAEDHIAHSTNGAYDFENQLDIARSYNGTYSTPIFANEAVKIIREKATVEDPFFLYVAFQDIHWPLQAPQEYIDLYANNTGGDKNRQHVCAMAKHLDDAIGNITSVIMELNLWDDTLLIFVGDNGGPTNNDEDTASNNFPLRGGKNTLWEGGNKVPLVVKGAGITKTNYINHEKLHASDWLPSLVSFAYSRSSGEDVDSIDWQAFSGNKNEPAFDPDHGDGYNNWRTISENTPSQRDFILLETHPESDPTAGHGSALIVGDYKVMKITNSSHNSIQNGWFPPPGESVNSTDYSITCSLDDPKKFQIGYSNDATQCQKAYCLFNIKEDPCEYYDISSKYPDILNALVEKLKGIQKTAVKSGVVGCAPVQVSIDGTNEKAWRPCDVSA